MYKKKHTNIFIYNNQRVWFGTNPSSLTDDDVVLCDERTDSNMNKHYSHIAHRITSPCRIIETEIDTEMKKKNVAWTLV